MSVAVPVIDYIDPATRRIYLLAGVTEYHPLDDIYAEVRNLRRTDESLRKYFVFTQGGGNIPKNVSGTLRTPRYAIFKNCKIVVSGDTYVTGEQLYADADGNMIGKGPDCVDHDLSPTNAYLDYEPPGSEVISVDTGGTFTEEDRAGMQNRHRWMFNKQELTDGGKLVLYDDDGVAIIGEQQLYIADGSKYKPPNDVPAKRDAVNDI